MKTVKTEFKKMKLEDIVPYDRNPRKNDKAVRAVVESIKQCSYISPIVVDEEKVILAGHTRYKALESLKYDEVDVLVVSGLTEEEKKKYRYLDNRTGEYAVWDILKLEKEIEGLDFGGFDFFGTAFDFSEIEDGDGDDEDGGGAGDGGSAATEYSTEDFADETFKYVCPKCGFKFN